MNLLKEEITKQKQKKKFSDNGAMKIGSSNVFAKIECSHF